MKTLACGTKQLKTVIAKENLKKPEQTQKKNFRTNRFCGTFGMVFAGILESDSSPWNLQNTDRQGRIHDDGYMSCPVESSKRRKQLDDMSSYPVESSKW